MRTRGKGQGRVRVTRRSRHGQDGFVEATRDLDQALAGSAWCACECKLSMATGTIGVQGGSPGRHHRNLPHLELLSANTQGGHVNRRAHERGFGAQSSRVLADSRHEGMVGGDKAEAARGNLCRSKRASASGCVQSRHARAHLVDALRVQVLGGIPRELTGDCRVKGER